MESVFNHYYSIPKKMMLLAGQWPYQEKRARFLRVSLLTVITLSMLIPQMAKIIRCDGNPRCILLIIPSLMLVLMILVKLFSCQFNTNNIKSLTNYLCDDWGKLGENAEEYEIMKTYAVNARLLSFVYSLYFYVASVIFLSVSLVPQVLNVVLPLNESRPMVMPYEAYYLVNDEEYFYYIFFHVSVSLNISIIGVLAHDCIFLVYIEHVCGLFAVAGFRLETLSRNVENNAANKSERLDDWKTYDRKIAIGVHVHWRALRFAELLEDTFCITFAVQMAIVIVTMSVTLLQITLQSDEVILTMKYMGFIIGQVMHLFFLSLQGQKLIDHSVQIRDKIYGSSWYNIPVKSQRLLLYILRRSLESNFMSAGKIYIFSLKSFTTVMQSSVSYFTVLASFQ